MGGRDAAAGLFQNLETNGVVEAALLVGRTGTLLAGWTRGPVLLEVLSVMAATLTASVTTILETMGDSSPAHVWIQAGRHHILATRMVRESVLVLIASNSANVVRLRRIARRLVSDLPDVERTLRRRPIDAAAREDAPERNVSIR